MGIFSALKRYILSLGGLISSDIDGATDKMLSTPSGVRATYEQTREKWTRQYAEVREAVASLMAVVEQKRQEMDALTKEAEAVRTKMNGAVRQYKATKDPKYRAAFEELYQRDKELAARQEQLKGEIGELQAKVNHYKTKLNDMQARIRDLKKQEAAAIADIVSSQQIVSLNDRLNSVSTELDDRNLRAVEERRANLLAQAKLSDDLSESPESADLEDELMAAGMQSEAADLFAAMMAEDDDGEAAEAPTDETARREI